MAPPKQPERRTALLDGTVEFLLDHGVRGFSLSPVSAALQTSPRMLLYHFGDKDLLINEAIETARSRHVALLTGWLAPHAGVPYRQILSSFWPKFSSRPAQRYNRLFAEVSALSTQPGSPFAAFGPRTVTDWLAVATSGFALEGHDHQTAEAHATIALALIRGLFLDLNATGHRARVERASRLLDVVLSGLEPN